MSIWQPYIVKMPSLPLHKQNLMGQNILPRKFNQQNTDSVGMGTSVCNHYRTKIIKNHFNETAPDFGDAWKDMCCLLNQWKRSVTRPSRDDLYCRCTSLKTLTFSVILKPRGWSLFSSAASQKRNHKDFQLNLLFLPSAAMLWCQRWDSKVCHEGGCQLHITATLYPLQHVLFIF